MSSRARLFSMGLVVLLCAGAASCSNDDDATTTPSAEPNDTSASAPDTSGSNDAASTTAATDDGEGAATTDAPDTTAAAAEPTGEPIRVGLITDQDRGQPEIITAVEAAAEAVNATGGVVPAAGGAGRPIEIVFCDLDIQVPSSPADCARELIDEDVVVSVAKFGLSGAVEPLSAAGIATFGNVATGLDDFTDPLSFPFSGGVPATVPGTAIALQRAGATDVAIMTMDAAEARALPAFVTPVLAGGEADLGPVVFLPIDPSADLQGFVSQVVDAQPSSVQIVTTSEMLVRVVKSLRQAGYEGLVGASAALITDDVLEELGDEAEGMVLAGSYEALTSTDNEVITTFLEELGAYDADAITSEFSLGAWLAVKEAAKIMSELPVIDAASFAAALDGREVDTGVSPSFTLGVSNTFTGLPRLFSATVQIQEVSGGKIAAVGDGAFVDVNELATPPG